MWRGACTAPTLTKTLSWRDSQLHSITQYLKDNINCISLAERMTVTKKDNILSHTYRPHILPHSLSPVTCDSHTNSMITFSFLLPVLIHFSKL